MIAFTKRTTPEPALESPQQAAARARQLLAGVKQAAAALRARDTASADAALEAGTRLAGAAETLAKALAGGDADAGARKDAEALLRKGVELLHRLHFEIIRADIRDEEDEDDAVALPLEDAARVAGELEEAARRLAGSGDGGGESGDTDAS